MIRRIIEIDQDRCNGCGLCATACHEGAIGMVNGKAKLLRDDYCDGLGDCLPACPVNAIRFVNREAAAYDEKAVQAARGGGCPGAASRQISPSEEAPAAAAPSRLSQWPVQIRLAAPNAPWLGGADLLIAADCTAYAYGNFHEDFIRGRATLVGCPKLDDVDYAEKLAALFAGNDLRSVTVVRMQVPCCGGMEMAARRALEACGGNIPLRVVTIGMDGKIIREVQA